MGKPSSRNKDRSNSKASSSQTSRRKSRSSKKLKSKKLRYRHDSSSISDTDFESSTSVSCSSSENDEKVVTSLSKTRKNAKPSNKRKRKDSKKDDRTKVKKTNKKKRTHITASLSCGDGSTTGNESEIERQRRRRRGRSRKRKGNMVKTERSRSRSNSHSTRSLCSDHQNEVEDDCYVENNFKRLRSVIVVVREENKLETFDGNELQEEITHQPDDDSPSFVDVNTNSNRKLDDVISIEAPEMETKKQVAIPDNINSTVVKEDEIKNEGCINDLDLNERNNGCSGNNDGINCIDLESILRQRALENLRRFKRVPPRDVETPAKCKVDNNNDAKQLYSLDSKSVHVASPTDEAKINSNGFPIQGCGNAANSMRVEENGVNSTDAIDSAVASAHDPVYSSQHLDRISNGSNALRPESKVIFLTKQASASQEPIPTKPSISDIGVDETAQTQTQMKNNDDQKISNGFGSSAHKPSSSSNSISGENSSNKSGLESGKGAQFEQKTMSVKRGGEMVQVNYKVYIPKKAPALTRRQLKR